jgi:hypothetical protein
MKTLFPFALLILVSAVSCKKDNIDPNPPADPAPETANGFPLTIGSYWIYENTTIDTNNVETVNVSNPSDSCYISGDSVIGGKTYLVFVGTIANENAVFFRRDSSGYMVDNYGKIYYSKTNFTDVLQSGSVPGYVDYSYKMVGPLTSVSVPAGVFPSYDFQGILVFTSAYPWDNPRYTHSYYAGGVGLVREINFFTSSPNYIARRLLRYHIQ